MGSVQSRKPNLRQLNRAWLSESAEHLPAGNQAHLWTFKLGTTKMVGPRVSSHLCRGFGQRLHSLSAGGLHAHMGMHSYVHMHAHTHLCMLCKGSCTCTPNVHVCTPGDTRAHSCGQRKHFLVIKAQTLDSSAICSTKSNSAMNALCDLEQVPLPLDVPRAPLVQ